MASILKQIGKKVNVPYRSYEADTVEDLKLIDVKNAIMGSRCYVINSGETYALNSQKEWKKVPTSSGGGSIGPDYDGGDLNGGGSEGGGSVDPGYDGGDLNGNPTNPDYDGGNLTL